MAQDVVESQAATLGAIRVEVYRCTRKLRTQPAMAGSLYKPLKTLEASKELMKDKHVDSVMQYEQ